MLKLHGSVFAAVDAISFIYAIDAEIPKLDVAGSTPVSRSIYFQLFTAFCLVPRVLIWPPQRRLTE